MFSLKSSAAVVLLGSILYYGLNLHVTNVTIGTKFGAIKGIVTKSRDGREFNSFLGIPYALPPVAERRFQPPTPFGSWNNVWDGSKMPSICPQFDILWQKMDGQEDCLYLNVYTPTKETNLLLPVIVFIHGGHFMYGGSDIYGPQYFMDEDVVVVTLNYRVGVLGFLNTGPDARGNMGLKDQTLALKWVQEAISDFGGNPNLVTLMGESAGGASVNYHMISPRSDGLFHRAISQSGTALCPWAFAQHAQDQGKRLGRKLGCPIGTTEALMKCLKEIDVWKIVETQAEIIEMFHSHDVVFAPSIDFDSGKDDDIFLSDNPRDSVADGQSARVPWMLGVVPEEGCFRSALIANLVNFKVIANNRTLLQDLEENWNEIAPTTFIYEKDDIVSQQIKNYYFGKGKNKFSKDDYQQLTKVYSDRYFFECIHEAAIHHAKDSPTFLYTLNYKTGMSIAQARVAAVGRFPVILELIWDYSIFRIRKAFGLEVPDYGVCHADELQYFFSTISLWEITKDSQHYAFSKNLVKLWVSFAKDGRPSNFQHVEWERAIPGKDLKYLLLGSRVEMIPEPFTEGIKFWQTLHV